MKAPENALDGIAADCVRSGKAARVSVSVCDLATRRWNSVNGKEDFAPGSMMKLPIMIAYFKLAQLNPPVLEQRFTYNSFSEGDDDREGMLSGLPLVVQESYTVNQLIHAMIVHSDNNAMYTLVTHMQQGFLHKTFKDLDISIPEDVRQQNFVNARCFAGIARKLYDAAYLDRADSQKALALLSESKYKPMAKALPDDVHVASKFGERVVKSADGSIQKAAMHDCGIVYTQPTPYSLCIMTEGTQLGTLSNTIGDISLAVYEMHRRHALGKS
jgi:formylmethanofuran dehydrogenase subunit D